MKVLIVGMLLLAGVAQCAPNVLFIAIDDLKPDLGCYGTTAVQTPHIDRLAGSGVTFLNNQCNWPVCGPSRASIMTGLRPEYSGVMNLKTRMRDVNPDLITIPQHFRAHGYETTGVGKIFDPRCVESREKDDPPSWSLPFSHVSYSKVQKDGKEVTAAPDVPDNKLTDGQICDIGVELMSKLAKQDKPFFLAVGFKKPHLPFVAPKKYWDLYDRNSIKLDKHQNKVADGTQFCWHDSHEVRGYKGTPKDKVFSPDFQRQLIHGYYACTSYVDAQVGRLLDQLDALKLRDNTIVVLWGDHGFHLGDHGIWGKHTALERAIRSPLIVSTPKTKKISVTAPTEFVDVFPTLCDLAGLKAPAGLHGTSLTPTFDGKTSVKAGALSMFRSGYSYRTERYRYTEWFGKKPNQVDLFDYETDPHELTNQANNPEYREIRAKLAAEMRQVSGCKKF